MMGIGRSALHASSVTRDMGLGFKAVYERGGDEWHEVRFFRYGRPVRQLRFRTEDDALRAFTTAQPDQMLRYLKAG
jgi:hypothetical protein